MTRRVAILVVTLVLLSALVVWVKSADRSFDRIATSRKIRIGYSIEPPYAFIDAQGRVTGQTPELARLVMEKLVISNGEYILMEFGALIPALEDGHVDVIAAGMFITPARAKRVAFSVPIFRVGQGLLVARGNPSGLHSYEDAATGADMRFAVLTGSVEEDLLRRLGAPQDRLVQVPDAATGRAAVENGLADALALSSPTIAWMTRTDGLGRLEAAEPFYQPDETLTKGLGHGAFVFRQKDQTLKTAWNEALTSVMRTGAYRDLMERFGFSEREMPADVGGREVLSR